MFDGNLFSPQILVIFIPIQSSLHVLPRTLILGQMRFGEFKQRECSGISWH